MAEVDRLPTEQGAPLVRKRVTIGVERLRVDINSMIRNTPEDFKAQREAMAVVLEHVLFETGNYSGFRYVDDGQGDRDPSRRVYL